MFVPFAIGMAAYTGMRETFLSFLADRGVIQNNSIAKDWAGAVALTNKSFRTAVDTAGNALIKTQKTTPNPDLERRDQQSQIELTRDNNRRGDIITTNQDRAWEYAIPAAVGFGLSLFVPAPIAIIGTLLTGAIATLCGNYVKDGAILALRQKVGEPILDTGTSIWGTVASWIRKNNLEQQEFITKLRSEPLTAIREAVNLRAATATQVEAGARSLANSARTSGLTSWWAAPALDGIANTASGLTA